MDLEKIKKRRKELLDKVNRNVLVWKPTPGKNKIRIVPSKFHPDNPFMEVWWHWNIGGNSVLCLKNNFGEQCPICEFAHKLWKSDSKEDKEIAKKLFANLRFYTPIIIRGEEESGVKYWGFGQQTYDELTSVLEDDSCGDFTDIESGRDIEVVMKTPEETGKKYATISAKIAFSNSPLSKDEKVIRQLLEDQKDIFEVFTKPTVDDVKGILEKWLNGEEDKEVIVDDNDNAVPAASANSKVTQTSNMETQPDEDELTEKFKKLFNSHEIPL